MPQLIPPVVVAGAMNGRPQPKIAVADGLVLRPWRVTDAAAVVKAFSDPDIQHWHFRRYDSVSEAQAWIEAELKGWQTEAKASFAIATTDDDHDEVDDVVVGRAALQPVLSDGYAELSYWVMPAARGRGIATSAAIALTRWAHELGLHRVELQHSTRNERSGRVARRAGFVSEGIRRGANLHDDGWHDMHLYSHLATD